MGISGWCCRFALAHQGTFSEQAFDQVDGQIGGLVAHVEGGIEFDDVERCQTTGVGDHLHAQLRFAVGRATAHGGADARRDVGVEEVDVETRD